MSWDITITPPNNMPQVEEPIVSFSSCPGNMYVAVRDLIKKQLNEMEPSEAIESLRGVIIELDKGNSGLFSDSYCYEAEKQWHDNTDLFELSKKNKDLLLRGINTLDGYKEYCGNSTRQRIRKTSVRFMLYYIAGYNISYSW